VEPRTPQKLNLLTGTDMSSCCAPGPDRFSALIAGAAHAHPILAAVNTTVNRFLTRSVKLPNNTRPSSMPTPSTFSHPITPSPATCFRIRMNARPFPLRPRSYSRSLARPLAWWPRSSAAKAERSRMGHGRYSWPRRRGGFWWIPRSQRRPVKRRRSQSFRRSRPRHLLARHALGRTSRRPRQNLRLPSRRNSRRIHQRGPSRRSLRLARL